MRNECTRKRAAAGLTAQRNRERSGWRNAAGCRSRLATFIWQKEVAVR